VASDPDKHALFDELVQLLRASGTDAELLALVEEPSWFERVSLENLRFLVGKHRELADLHAQNAGLYERWQASKRDPR
jgi:hypothetical protein